MQQVTPTITQTTEGARIRRIADMAFLFALGLYILYIDITKTTMQLELPENPERYLLGLLAAIAVIRLTAEQTDRRRHLTFTIAGLAILAVYVLIFRENHSLTPLFIGVMTIGCLGIHYDRILKTYIAAASTVILSAMFMAWIGAIENFVYIREITIRSSWGIKYPTDMMSLLFFLLMSLWIVCRRRDDLWFLVPAGILLIMSWAVADSRTGMMCDACVIVVLLISYALSRRELPQLRKLIGILACVAFPLFTVFSGGLLWAYRHGNALAIRANGYMSDRLSLSSDALDKYGITLLGKQVKQVGWGGSTFDKPDYAFVDISYILILLSFGIVGLLLINILWVWMTRRAYRLGDMRLMLALALIAFNAATEHHITQINYDIFLVLPLSVLALPVPEGAKAIQPAPRPPGWGKAAAARIIIAGVLYGAALAGFLAILPAARTITALTGIADAASGRRLLFLLCAALIWLTLAAAFSLYRLLTRKLTGEAIGRNRAMLQLSAVILFAIVLCTGTIVGSRILGQGMEKEAALMETESPAVKTALSNGKGRLYVTDLPSLYRREFGGIRSGLYNGEELGKYNDTSILMAKDTDSPPLFDSGFLYTPISDRHALFTNDQKVIRALKDGGYHLTGYYPGRLDVDMAEEAELNERHLEEDGSIVLRGEEETLKKGPRANLREGRYTFTVDLSLPKQDKTASASGREPVCTVKADCREGRDVLFETPVYASDFDQKGNCHFTATLNIPDSVKTNIKVLPADDHTVIVRGMSCQKTPEYDVHSIYNADRVRIWEEYYDLDGNPDPGDRGYVAKKLGYDERGNINREEFYDENREKVIGALGCAELRRTFNDLNQDIRDEYYGLDGKQMTRPPGQAATEFGYDDMNRQTDLRYYDIHNKPVMIGGEDWGGYQQIKRIFDDGWTILREDFLDSDGRPVMTRDGYASRELVYDDYGNFTGYRFYDLDGKEVQVP